MTLKEKIEDLRKKRETINALHQDLANLAEEYKAELKALVGVTEGEKVDVLTTVEMILKIKEMQ